VLYEAWTFAWRIIRSGFPRPRSDRPQTDQTIHNTTLSAARALNSKVSLDLDFNQTITLVSGYEDSYDCPRSNGSTTNSCRAWTPAWASARLRVRGNRRLGNNVAAQPGGLNNLDQYYEQLQDG